MRTVAGSEASTVSTAANKGATGPFWAIVRSSEALTSADVKSAPSWNLTPLRSVKIHVLGSGVVHWVASSGTSWLLVGSRVTSASSTCRVYVCVERSTEFAPCTSSETTFSGVTTFSSPAGGRACAATAGAAVGCATAADVGCAAGAVVATGLLAAVAGAVVAAGAAGAAVALPDGAVDWHAASRLAPEPAASSAPAVFKN